MIGVGIASGASARHFHGPFASDSCALERERERELVRIVIASR